MGVCVYECLHVCVVWVFVYMNVCMCMGASVCVGVGAHVCGGQKMTLNAMTINRMETFFISFHDICSGNMEF